MTRLTPRRVRLTLEALTALDGARRPDEAARAALDAAVSTVGADTAQLTRIDNQGGAIWSCPPGFLDHSQMAVFDTVHAASPWPAATYTRTGSGLALRISDICSPREYRSTPMYTELFKSLSVKHQVAFSVPTSAGHTLCLSLQRDSSDFTDDECQALNALRPCLQAAARRYPAGHAVHVRPTAPAPTEQLTGREQEVLHLAASGMSDLQIARRLSISAHTVSKHLQHLYRKTGTTNRTQASALLDQLPVTASDAFAEGV